MSSENRKILEETHTRYLDALRHREQDILQYLTFFVPAIAGFGWVLHNTDGKGFEFFCGAVVTIGLLLLGAVYSWALGYNYRYVVFALVKLEKLLDIRKAMPIKWQRIPKDFLGHYEPPEMIHVFWLAFIVSIVVVTGTATYKFHSGLICPEAACKELGCISKTEIGKAMIFFTGAICLLLGSWWTPKCFSKKLYELYKAEDDEVKDWTTEEFFPAPFSRR